MERHMLGDAGRNRRAGEAMTPWNTDAKAPSFACSASRPGDRPETGTSEAARQWPNVPGKLLNYYSQEQRNFSHGKQKIKKS